MNSEGRWNLMESSLSTTTIPGDGVFNIPDVVHQALQSGADHFFLERDLAPDPEKTLRNSFKNLQAIEW